MRPKEASQARDRRSPIAALRERVKELECLYAIAQISADERATLPDVLRRVGEVLPRALRFPSLAVAGVRFDDGLYGPSEAGAAPVETFPILVRGTRRGVVYAGYRSAGAARGRPRILKEERRLLAEVARRMAHIAEQIEARQSQEALRVQLRHAERLATVGQLASGVAHELNEPLGSILGFAQLMAKTAKLSRAARGDLRKIETAALHARGIIRNLMLFARQSAPDFAAVRLNDIVGESAGLLLWRCEDSRIQVIQQREAFLPEILADGRQLRQVVINLILNAIQAMPNGGRMILATNRGTDGVEFSVSDTGEGMSPEVIQRIFDPFFTTKDVDQGTGLGLSIVHGIVSDHGGRIAVDSEPGRGTRFRVWLPKGPAVAGTVHRGAGDAAADEGTNSRCR